MKNRLIKIIKISQNTNNILGKIFFIEKTDYFTKYALNIK
jgi:hypothetical protein